MARNIVLDTSSIIKYPECLKKVENTSVFVPLVVIEELDHIKSKYGEASASARRFIKELDALSNGQLTRFPGVDIGRGSSLSIIFCNQDDASGVCGEALDFKKNDNQILSACIVAQSLYCGEDDIVLMSEDRNLRIKARSVGIESGGFDGGDDCQCNGIQCIEDVPAGIIDELFQSSVGIEPAIVKVNPAVNEYMVLRNGSISALVTCRPDGLIRRVKKKDVSGITPKNSEQTFAVDALTNPDIKLVSLIGKAGTGKTLLTLAAALEQKSQYRQIMLSRPVVPLGNDVGYLPGDIKEKLAPYMQPLFDNLDIIKEASGDKPGAGDKIGKMIEDQKIVIEPLTYIRGRSLIKKFLIVDEAQNLNAHELKTIITRAGEGTKIVLTGDVHQIDQHGMDSESNGLAYVDEKLKGQPVYASVRLEKGERSELATIAGALL